MTDTLSNRERLEKAAHHFRMNAAAARRSRAAFAALWKDCSDVEREAAVRNVTGLNLDGASFNAVCERLT